MNDLVADADFGQEYLAQRQMAQLQDPIAAMRARVAAREATAQQPSIPGTGSADKAPAAGGAPPATPSAAEIQADARAKGMDVPDPAQAELMAQDLRAVAERWAKSGKPKPPEDANTSTTVRFSSRMEPPPIGKIAADVGQGIGESVTQAIGGVSDAVHSAFSAADDLASWMRERFKDATGIDPTLPSTGIDALDNPLKSIAGEKDEVPPAKSVTGGLIRDTSRFLSAFLPMMRLAKGAGTAAQVSTSVAAGGVADAVTRDPAEKNLANLIQEHPEIGNPITEFLAANPDDDEATARLKKGLEGAGLGVVAEGLMLVVRAMRAARQAKMPRQGVANALEDQRAKYGEVTDADLSLLGDPNRPLIDNAAAAPSQTAGVRFENWAPKTGREPSPADKLRAGQAEADNLGVPDAVAARGLVGASRPSVLSADPAGLGDLVQQVRDLVTRAIQGNAKGRVTLGPVSDDGAAAINEVLRNAHAGVQDVSGFTHTIDADEIRHIYRRHVGANETDPRGVPLTEDDLARIPEILASPDTISISKAGGRHRPPSIVYSKEIEGTVYLVEEVQRGQSQLAVTTMWKQASEGGTGLGGTMPRPGETPRPVRPETATSGPVENISADGVFINFARIDTPEDIQRVMRDMADAFKGSISEASRGVQSNAETKDLADRFGMTVEQLLSRRKGQPLSAEEALAARQLWAASAEKLYEAALKVNAPNAGDIDHFIFRKLMATHHAIQAEVMAARTETARALQSWSIPAGGSIEKAAQIQAMIEGSGGTAVSKQAAADLVKMVRLGASDAAVSTFVRKTWAASTVGAVQEAWINGLLSNPKTHAVNIVSNTVALAQQIYERGTAAGLAKLTGTADSVAPGEAAAMTYALITGLGDAFRMGAKALRTGDTGAALGKVEAARLPQINGDWLREAGWNGAAGTVDLIGRMFRVPNRLLGAEDEFFKAIAYRMEVHAQAVRQATAEGLQGPSLMERAAQLANEPSEAIRLAAADSAAYVTFTNQTGKFGEALTRLRNSVPAGAFILPFVRTPVNIARFAYERSPLAPLTAQWRADIAAGGARKDLALARMGTGSAIMALAFDLADRGLISGSGPKDNGEREALMRQGWQPNSIKLGDTWYSYGRVDPFGMTMGFSADLAELLRRSDVHPEKLDEVNEILGGSMAIVANATINKTYMQGISQAIEAVHEPDQHAAQFVTNFLGSAVPSGVNAAAQLNDPTMRQTMQLWDGMTARLPVLAASLMPKRDLWGQERRIPESGLGNAYDVFSPIAISQRRASPIDGELQRLNWGPQRIELKADWDGAHVSFRDWPEVYDAYVRLAGNELKHPTWDLGAKDYLDEVVTGKSPMSETYKMEKDTSDPNNGGKAAFIQHTVNEYRALARQAIEADPKFADFKIEVDRARNKRQDLQMPVDTSAPEISRPAVSAVQPRLQ